MARVIVVGGSSGIGAAIAGKCAAEGHRVVTLQRRADASGIELDLRWPKEEIQKSTERAIVALGGKLDWLVLAGGVGAYTRPLTTDDILVEMIQTNYIGPRMVFEAALKCLRNSKEARVLYVSSRIVDNPTPALEDYAASKAAGETAFRALGRRYARWNIRTVVLQTGWVLTPMTESIDEELQAKALRHAAIRRWIEPEEVAAVAYSILTGPDSWTCDIVQMSGGL